MLLTTQNQFSEYEITQTLGLVKGNTVRARHMGKDMMAAFRNIVGGDVDVYIMLLSDSRDLAIDRMIVNAKMLGADGIVGIRFTTSSIMQAASEILAYGTAVKL